MLALRAKAKELTSNNKISAKNAAIILRYRKFGKIMLHRKTNAGLTLFEDNNKNY